jgi:hypothetical protein
LEWLQPWTAIDDAWKTSPAKRPSSWRMMVKTSSRWCMDVVLGKAMSSSLSFFDRFWKWPKMKFWENERTRVCLL